MNREIPGYYFGNPSIDPLSICNLLTLREDPEKKKYFKIEKSHTAPTTASWSSDAVKRRKIQDTANQADRRRAHLVRDHIKRHAISKDVVSSGLLIRELGFGPVAEHGRGRIQNGPFVAEAWTRGVVAKGSIPFVPSFARARYANMPCFYVGAEDTKTGLGVAYATLDEETLVGSYIPTDSNEKHEQLPHLVRFSRNAPNPYGTNLSFRTEMIRCPQMSSIKYHRPSHHILLTSREPDHSCGLYFFAPPRSGEDSDRPHWLLGDTNHYQRLSIQHGLRDEWLVHGATPAPASSDLICIVGTNDGILRVHSNETMTWVAPKPKGNASPQEIFSQDFQQDNHNVIVAGGRKPRLWTTDLRAPEKEWRFTKHASSIAHVRSVNPHQILVAGLQNTMSLYDMRFFGSRANGTKPLLTFPDHRNDAHFQIGWDVSPQLNVVAAAQDNGTVKLFSLNTGRRLRNSTLDAMHTDTPIKALLFQTMPHEKMPSLFIGEGPSLRKFSFGTVEMEDEA
ncbi:Fc.00g007570.m01.CDS01 [Cosmosporella sp. VM-42]